MTDITTDAPSTAQTNRQIAPRLYPFLRGDAIFLAHHEGAIVKDGHGSYLVRGAGAYTWLATLSGQFDGVHTLDEILDALPGHLRSTAATLIDLLAGKGTLVWVDEVEEADAEQPLSAIESFLSNWTPTPRARAKRFTDTAVTIVGNDVVTDSARRALEDNGAQNVTMTTDIHSVRGAEWVFASTMSLPLRDARALAERASSGEFSLLPLIATERALVLGPWCRPGEPSTVDAVLDGLERNATGTGKLWRSAALGIKLPLQIPETVLEVAGVNAAFELFRDVTDAYPSDLDHRASVIDVPTLDSRLERVVVDLRENEAEISRTHGSADIPTSIANAVDSMLTLLGTKIGLFRGLDDDDVPQAPLFVGRIDHGWTNPLARNSTIGVSTTNLLDARASALLTSVAAVTAELSFAGSPTIDTDTRSGIAAGIGIADATDRARWKVMTNYLLERVINSTEIPVAAGAPDNPLTHHLVQYLGDHGLKPRYYSWPTSGKSLALAVLTDKDGIVRHWNALAATTVSKACEGALVALVGWVQVGLDERSSRLATLLDVPSLTAHAVESRAGTDNTALYGVSELAEEIGAGFRDYDITPAALAAIVPVSVVRSEIYVKEESR